MKSESIAPLWVDGSVGGAFVLDCDRAERAWAPGVVERFLAKSTIFGNSLAHKRARESRDAAMRFVRTAASIVARLLAPPWADPDAVLEAGLREVAQALGADRVTQWRQLLLNAFGALAKCGPEVRRVQVRARRGRAGGYGAREQDPEEPAPRRFPDDLDVLAVRARDTLAALPSHARETSCSVVRRS